MKLDRFSWMIRGRKGDNLGNRSLMNYRKIRGDKAEDL